MLTDNWKDLTPDEKFQTRFDKWMNQEGVEFAPGAKEAYLERSQIIKDAIELKKPSRIPVCPMIGFFPAYHAGVSCEDVMYNYDKLKLAWTKYHRDMQPDSMAGSFLMSSGKTLEHLGYTLYKWPGHGTNPNTPYQCWEKEYMMADEYDDLINDPTRYWMTKYMPRIFEAFAPWQMLGPFTDIIELPFVPATMIPFGIPDVQESLKKLIEAGNLAMEWIQAVGATDGETMATQGIPPFLGGMCKAPFDTLGDTLRGTQPLMLDIFRQPDKVLKAMEVLIPMNIEMGVRSATTNNCPMVFIPLHKGADGFMSKDQYRKFYWPQLKAVMLGLIEEGLVPLLFAEGGYNERLDIINDPEVPAGRSMWYFDTTDMEKAKAALHGQACICGNLPASVFQAGKPQDVEEYAKNLIETIGKDGGFILGNGSVLDEAPSENVKAMFEAGRKYGS